MAGALCRSGVSVCPEWPVPTNGRTNALCRSRSDGLRRGGASRRHRDRRRRARRRLGAARLLGGSAGAPDPADGHPWHARLDHPSQLLERLRQQERPEVAARPAIRRARLPRVCLLGRRLLLHAQREHHARRGRGQQLLLCAACHTVPHARGASVPPTVHSSVHASATRRRSPRCSGGVVGRSRMARTSRSGSRAASTGRASRALARARCAVCRRTSCAARGRASTSCPRARTCPSSRRCPASRPTRSTSSSRASCGPLSDASTCQAWMAARERRRCEGESQRTELSAVCWRSIWMWVRSLP